MEVDKFLEIVRETKKVNLYKWIELQTLKDKIASSGGIEFVDHLFKFIVVAEEALNTDDLEALPWFIIGEGFQFLDFINVPNIEFPFLRTSPEERTRNKTRISWDYSERLWFIWLYAFSKEFGWNIEAVKDLDIETACGLMQEIIVNEQMEKEFVHSLSEVSYPYDTSSKSSKYKPLERPAWMRPIFVEKIVKYPKSFYPEGNVVKLDLENGNKNTEPKRGV